MTVAALHLPGDSPRDFPEDVKLYYNKCYRCDLMFVGHRRRVFCKQCDDYLALKAEGNPPSTNNS